MTELRKYGFTEQRKYGITEVRTHGDDGNMTQDRSDFFAILRETRNGEPYEVDLNTEAWNEIFRQAQRQSVSGVMWPMVKDRKLPHDIAYQWVGIAERIRGLNELLNKEAARLTQLFEKAGRRSVILKGQANARLYGSWLKVHGSRLKDNKDRLALLRTPGDIDIWVEGGRESVVELLIGLGLLEERPTIANAGKRGRATANNHHIHLPATKGGIVVEVHFRPSSGNYCPWTNRRLQRWLEREVLSVTKVEEGFNVPSIRFALVMQLSHIQRHFLSSGVGLRQICDYYWLLRNSISEDRQKVSEVLERFGLRRTAGALMWVLGETLHLDEELMICEKDEWRGEWMLRVIWEGGNFGHYSHAGAGKWKRFFGSKLRHFKLMRFDFWEVVWMEINYWKAIVKTVPERVRRGKLSLGEG